MGAHSMAPRFKRARSILTIAVLTAGALVWAASPSQAAAPVVTLESGISGCNGVRPTPGSENTNKRLVSGDLEPGGTVTFEISFPVDPADVGQDFAITDCVFINDVAALKYTVAFVPNNTNFLLTFNLQIPADAPIGAEYCNDAKTTQSPSASPASNRKAGPACFHIGGDLRIIKEETGDASHTPIAGATFSVSCPTNVTIPPVVISGLSGSTTYSNGAYQASGTAGTGVIAIAGPAGTQCTVTETAPPPGYDLPAVHQFTYTIPVGSSQSVNYIDDPRSKNTTAISTTAVDGTVGSPIHDTATLSGATANAGGTITFNLYGPSATANCSGAVVYTHTVSVSGNGDYNSGNFTPTAAGSYYWVASYSGDGSNLASSGSCGDQGETSSVQKTTTLIATAASSQTVGAAVHDVATLSGATATAGGSITFQAWGPSDTPDCTGNATFTSTVPVSGNGNYPSADFTPSTAGKYYWIATYSGDPNNTGSAGTCGDAGETSTIGKKTTLIGTAASSQIVGASVQDVATLSGATANAGGSIVFNAYGPSASPNCSGAIVFTSTVPVSGPGDYASGAFTPTTAGLYYWIATYSGDANNLPSAGICGDQGETSTIGKKTTLIATAASSETIGASVHDVATLSGGLNPTGSIVFNLYGPSSTPNCSGPAVYTATVAVNHGNGDYDSGNFTPSTAGSYYWTATYSGDVNNLPSNDVCGAQGETSVLVKRTTGITTTATNATIGSSVSDVAHLTGATANAGGMITFSLYGPSPSANCSGAAVYSHSVTVSGPGDYNSGSFTPLTAGNYYWIASYSGDVNNLASSGACGDTNETSTVGKQPTGITTVATSGTFGDAVHDVATLSGATANAGGTISFTLYGPSASPNCSGQSVYSKTVDVSGPGDYNSGDYTPTAAGSYYWIAMYSGDVNNQPSSGTCGDSGETSTLAKRPTGIVTSATSGTVGDAIHDVATLSGASAAAGGSIVFNAYGPSASPNCLGAVVFTSTVPVDGNGDYNSGNFTPTTAGSYYWIASYSGDPNNLPSSGTCGDAGETSTLAKSPTAIVTTATSATIGDAISDSATLSLGFNPTGSISFNLYGPSDSPNCTDAIFTSIKTVTGNGVYNSDSYTPATAGNYYWVASYGGDINNLPSSGTCGDQGETSQIGKETTLIGTAASSQTVGTAVHDVATLSGATANAGGTITFRVWGPSETANCTGDPVFHDSVPVSGPGDYQSGDFTPDTAGLYYWTATYSGDPNNLPSAGACGDDGETSTIGKRTTVIGTDATSATIGATIHDQAGLLGATANAGGTITFYLYGPSETPDCAGDPVFTDTVDVDGAGNYLSGDFTPTTAGDYYWIASYSGDVNNLPSTGLCGDEGETSTIDQRPTSIGTASTSDTIGAAVHDVATLGGATDDATGTITFSLYGPSATPDCTSDPVFTDSVDVAGPGDYTSGDFTAAIAGSYYWVAAYSGDVNNLPSTGTCGDDGETSGLGQSATNITTHASSGTFGGKFVDTATLTGATADATGTITFNLYGPSDTPDCSGTSLFTSTVEVAGPGDYKADGFTPTEFGHYYWTASYSGDVNNLASEEPCGSPHETSLLASLPTSVPPPPTPPTTPPAHGTSGTGTPVQAELALVLLLLGAGGLLLLLGRRRRGSRQI